MARSVLIMLAVLQLSGCADLARWVRQYTYPPEFRYIERDEVRGAMRQLASHAHQLNRLMRADDGPQVHRAEMIGHLRAMEVAAESLDSSGWPTNHPMIDMNLPSLRRDLKFAREAMEREPPNFLLAGPVAGACVYCHGGSR